MNKICLYLLVLLISDNIFSGNLFRHCNNKALTNNHFMPYPRLIKSPIKDLSKNAFNEFQSIFQMKMEQSWRLRDDTLIKDSSKLNSNPIEKETDAEFPGSKAGWLSYLNKNLEYPTETQDNEISGDIVVQFIVNQDGSLSDIKCVSGPKKGGLRKEALRIVTNSGKWIPATMNRTPISKMKEVTISFRLSVGNR